MGAQQFADLLEQGSRRAEALSEDLPRDLRVLDDIDGTLQALQEERDFFFALTALIRREITALRTDKSQTVIDQDGSVRKKLLDAQNRTEQYHAHLKQCCDCARSDPALRDDDGVVDEYCKCIRAVADFHNGLNDFRWAIGEHDADRRPPMGPFTITQLEAFLTR